MVPKTAEDYEREARLAALEEAKLAAREEARAKDTGTKKATAVAKGKVTAADAKGKGKAPATDNMKRAFTLISMDFIMDRLRQLPNTILYVMDCCYASRGVVHLGDDHFVLATQEEWQRCARDVIDLQGARMIC